MSESRLENAVEIKGGMNGLKFILGASMIVLANQISYLHTLLPTYPDDLWWQTALNYLNLAVSVIQKTISILGNTFLGIGAVHKVIKLLGY